MGCGSSKSRVAAEVTPADAERRRRQNERDQALAEMQELKVEADELRAMKAMVRRENIEEEESPKSKKKKKKKNAKKAADDAAADEQTPVSPLLDANAPSSSDNAVSEEKTSKKATKEKKKKKGKYDEEPARPDVDAPAAVTPPELAVEDVTEAAPSPMPAAAAAAVAVPSSPSSPKPILKQSSTISESEENAPSPPSLAKAKSVSFCNPMPEKLYQAISRGDDERLLGLLGDGIDEEAEKAEAEAERRSRADSVFERFCMAYYACSYGHERCLQVLIECGADVHATGEQTDSQHLTAIAAQNGHRACLELLLSAPFPGLSTAPRPPKKAPSLAGSLMNLVRHGSMRAPTGASPTADAADGAGGGNNVMSEKERKAAAKAVLKEAKKAAKKAEKERRKQLKAAAKAGAEEDDEDEDGVLHSPPPGEEEAESKAARKKRLKAEKKAKKMAEVPNRMASFDD